MINRTFGEKIISFYTDLNFDGSLPAGIKIMNPYRENPEIIPAITKFYSGFYNDTGTRHLILGINPGRFGAGVTGIPFTDTIRLKEKCGIEIPGLRSFETSSVFIYEMIDSYGGPNKFFNDFYISSVSPLGFTSMGKAGKELNYNYYDNRELADSILDFILRSLRIQIDFGIDRDICFCLGTGKNFKYLSDLNKKHHFFKNVEPLEHPRFIMQYKSKLKQNYISVYLGKFSWIKS